MLVEHCASSYWDRRLLIRQKRDERNCSCRGHCNAAFPCHNGLRNSNHCLWPGATAAWAGGDAGIVSCHLDQAVDTKGNGCQEGEQQDDDEGDDVVLLHFGGWLWCEVCWCKTRRDGRLNSRMRQERRFLSLKDQLILWFSEFELWLLKSRYREMHRVKRRMRECM